MTPFQSDALLILVACAIVAYCAHGVRDMTRRLVDMEGRQRAMTETLDKTAWPPMLVPSAYRVTRDCRRVFVLAGLGAFLLATFHTLRLLGGS